MEKKSALQEQCDGNHYKVMKLQPVELGYKLGATPCFVKLAKYLTRDKNDKKVNLQKAYHCICLEEDLNQQAEMYYLRDHLDFWNDNGSQWRVDELIELFHEDLNIQNALKTMYSRDYNLAKYYVNQYAMSVIGEKVGE